MMCTRTRSARDAALLAALSLASLAPPAAAQEGAQETQEPAVRYGRVVRATSLHNVPHASGRVVLELAEGAVVRLHGEDSDWSKVEVPNGFPAWVHGKYVSETEEPGVVEITRNGVNVRAEPSAGPNNYPITQLYAGDRAREATPPAELPEGAEEWVYIWSPPGLWAWTPSSDVRPLAPGEDGAALWKEARGLVAPKPKANAGPGAREAAPREASAGVTAASEALERANAAFERETASQNPNFELLRLAYDAVLELTDDASVKRLVEERLERVALLESAVDLRRELEAERAAEEARLAAEGERIRKDIAAEARRKDPFRDRFDERGLLERRSFGEETRYFLRWGGRDVCEVLCSSGRYELDLFLGFDVGVRGRVLPLPGGNAGEKAPVVFDVERIEILARG